MMEFRLTVKTMLVTWRTHVNRYIGYNLDESRVQLHNLRALRRKLLLVSGDSNIMTQKIVCLKMFAQLNISAW